MSRTYVLSVDGSEWARLEDYRRLEQQLVEARAALWTHPDPNLYPDDAGGTRIGHFANDVLQWRADNAAAIKAAAATFAHWGALSEAACSYDLEHVRQELAEARAALRDAEKWSTWTCPDSWHRRHAAAIKAARGEGS